jgi:hypothetical protein
VPATVWLLGVNVSMASALFIVLYARHLAPDDEALRDLAEVATGAVGSPDTAKEGATWLQAARRSSS